MLATEKAFRIEMREFPWETRGMVVGFLRPKYRLAEQRALPALVGPSTVLCAPPPSPPHVGPAAGLYLKAVFTELTTHPFLP